MKLALITPIPIEFNSAKRILKLTEDTMYSGCRLGTGKRKNLGIFCCQSGSGKNRAAQATAALVMAYTPDLIVDTGTCAGLMADARIGDVILGKSCFEFDVGGQGLPRRMIREMELPSAFAFLSESSRQNLIREACAAPADGSYRVIAGIQASGEFLVNGVSMKNLLVELFHASGANWETAGVFVSALRAAIPAISLRTVSDLGDEQALKEFKMHARSAAQILFRHIDGLIASNWFGRFLAEWDKVPPGVKAKMPASVLP
jgi:adenosylhomocysteine nucleosidase